MKKHAAPQLDSAIATLNQYYGNTFVIKLGGSLLNHDDLTQSLCIDLKLLKQAGIRIIIVHGGSLAINQALAKHNMTPFFIDGLRVTSLEIMKIIETVLYHQVNRRLVKQLNAIGIPAIGLSGNDHNLFQCDYYSNQHGYVGVIRSVHTAVVKQLIADTCHAIPVIAPIGTHVAGGAVNINADDAASHLAIALKADKLIYLTDQEGIYNKEGLLLSKLFDHDLLKLIHNQTVKNGMLVKTKAIITALKNNLNHIYILNGNKKQILIKALLTTDDIGTLCKKGQSNKNTLAVSI